MDPHTKKLPHMRGCELNESIGENYKRRREKELIGDESDPVQFKRPRRRTSYSDLPVEIIQLIGEKIDSIPSIECFRATEKRAYVNVESVESKIKRITLKIAESKSCWREYSKEKILGLLEAILKDVINWMGMNIQVYLDEYYPSSGDVCATRDIIYHLIVNIPHHDLLFLMIRDERVQIDIVNVLNVDVDTHKVDHALSHFLKVLYIIMDTLDMDTHYITKFSTSCLSHHSKE